MNLARLQHEHKIWVDHNFPNQQPWEPILGVSEEAGELAHAYLKHMQGIRGMADEEAAIKKMEDAVGDVVIYLASFCNSMNLSLAACVRTAWEEVKARDWQADKETGTP